MTSKAAQWLATGTRPNATKRRDDEPSPGLAFGKDAASHVWMDEEPTPEGVVAAKLPQMVKRQGAGRTERYGERPGRDADEPAFTLTTGGGEGGGTGHVPLWSDADKPATTVQGDPRIAPRGHRVNGDDVVRLGEEEAAARYSDRRGSKAVRVSVEEAAVLQSFRPDYVWTGTKTAQYRQVGDAVPPVLGAAVLRRLFACIAEARGVSPAS